jgi:integrase
VNLELACLKHLFSKAIEWDEAKDNPVKRVKFFRVNNARTRYLTEEEIFRLIDACDGQLKSIILLALHTGMRRGEIFRLKWSDVDFRSGNIIVTLSKNGECRKIPMNETADNVLRELKKEAASEFVFRNRYNENEPPKDIKTAFNNAVKKAGIENFRFHDLRHTFASHLVMNGVDLKTVQEFLGHKTFIMTLRYSHLSPAHRREAIKVMDLVAKDLKKHTNCTLVNFSGQAESETC